MCAPGVSQQGAGRGCGGWPPAYRLVVNISAVAIGSKGLADGRRDEGDGERARDRVAKVLVEPRALRMPDRCRISKS